MNFIELLGAICSLICVWLNTQGKPQAWYWAIVGGVLYAWIFWEAKLYGNFLVQIIFCGLSVYGFWEWHFNKKIIENNSKNNTENNIENASTYKYFPQKHYFLLFLINAILLLILYVTFIYLFKIENNFITMLDIMSSVGSVVAQYLLAKKYLENWFFWIVVNVLVIIIMVFSVLYITAFLYFLFLILAIYGYFTWKNDILDKKV